ncbi:hypothetical protein B0H13DRAFT_1923187 [Mycena leptocephala]|nr:hypothetical protein B0H13DRAFT_1923187 [Mycena leptocephala]
MLTFAQPLHSIVELLFITWSVNASFRIPQSYSDLIGDAEMNAFKGKLSTVKQKPRDKMRMSRLKNKKLSRPIVALRDSESGDNESLLPRSPHSMCLEGWMEEAFALAVKGYVGNWKLQRDVLKMIPTTIQPTLYQKQSIDMSPATHFVVDGICPVIKNECLEKIRMQSIAKEIDRERREHEEITL